MTTTTWLIIRAVIRGGDPRLRALRKVYNYRYQLKASLYLTDEINKTHEITF